MNPNTVAPGPPPSSGPVVVGGPGSAGPSRFFRPIINAAWHHKLLAVVAGILFIAATGLTLVLAFYTPSQPLSVATEETPEGIKVDTNGDGQPDTLITGDGTVKPDDPAAGTNDTNQPAGQGGGPAQSSGGSGSGSGSSSSGGDGGGNVLGCSSPSNTPGGADPWGGCWPGPDNTGLAGCPALTTHNGDMTVGSNTTVENKLINGQLRVLAAGATNITIRCVKVVDSGYFPIDTERSGPYTAGSILLDRVEVDCGGSATTHAGLLLFGATARRVNVHNCPDGFRFADSATIEDSYCHDLFVMGDDETDIHYDCSQTGGGSNFVIRHNSLVGKDTSDIAVWPEVWNGVVSPVSNVLIERNLLIGTPGYTIYIGKDHGSTPGNTNSTTNVTVKENRFGPAGYGPCSIVNASPTWVGNVWNDTGAALPFSSC